MADNTNFEPSRDAILTSMEVARVMSNDLLIRTRKSITGAVGSIILYGLAVISDTHDAAGELSSSELLAAFSFLASGIYTGRLMMKNADSNADYHDLKEQLSLTEF